MKDLLDLVHLNIDFPITDPTWIFFLLLVIILFAPIVLERLRIPHIIGMILAGIVIGEHGFNILARDSSFELFGKVGLYYIMFLAGLEMNMEDFKSIRVKATVLGLLAFIFPLGIGVWTNLNLLGYGLITSVLLASMYASHTLIAYPIVIRYGGDGYADLVGSGRHCRYVQGRYLGYVLGVAGAESRSAERGDYADFPSYRTLVLPSL